MSVEEEKGNSVISETSSVHSGKKSSCSSSKARRNRRKKHNAKYHVGDIMQPSDIDVHMENDEQEEHQEKPKKVVHFNDQNIGHIELRDLKEKIGRAHV